MPWISSIVLYMLYACFLYMCRVALMAHRTPNDDDDDDDDDDDARDATGVRVRRR